ncbi:hypothetical protein [Apilactobacillus ozensis]|uniref:hypothetical protein n=1 Tax=Apilactobacillus ozensis TaxID=866801 RepID=UPI002091FA98|nr:hypothetical protein [Apilactobacillus ozensis]
MRDDAKEMDSNNLNLFNANPDLVDEVPFTFPKIESYKVLMDKEKQKKSFKEKCLSRVFRS